NAAQDPAVPVEDTLDSVRAELEVSRLPGAVTVSDVTTWDEFCARPEPPHTWAVEGLIDVEDRIIIVAPEGMGKTMLMRQIALATGQGLHPFHLSWIDPITTLLVDLENPGRIIRSKGRPMLEQARIRAGADYEPTRTWIWHRPGGIDLRSRTGAAELNAVCQQVRPTLVCMGPLYKSYRAADAKNEHHAALEVAGVLDDLRTRHGFALVLEAHAPMKQGGVRDLRPFGTLLWQQWPEVGLKLIPEGEEDTPWFGHTLKVGSWRGSRDERPWPTTLVRNTEGGWPWVAA
ncbi:MAG TPA: AAA family ATPase, partial [Acidimicrobiales bacterium]|nr:AAA family ATPase [Acidimicrobiales bacterium]